MVLVEEGDHVAATHAQVAQGSGQASYALLPLCPRPGAAEVGHRLRVGGGLRPVGQAVVEELGVRELCLSGGGCRGHCAQALGVSVTTWRARYCWMPTRAIASSWPSNQSACPSSSRTDSSKNAVVPWSLRSWHSRAEALNCAMAAFSLASARVSISSASSPTVIELSFCTLGWPSNIRIRLISSSASFISAIERS